MENKADVYFQREINLIQNKPLQEMVWRYMNECVPDYFWTIGASSTGKFHPAFSQGEGGLVRHTKAVVMFAEELLRMSTYAYMKDIYKDYVIAACIVHDTRKYGYPEFNKADYPDHAPAAANAFDDFCVEHDYLLSELCKNAIAAHMGQWSTNREDKPFTSIDRCVHLADYIASRNFIDIPQITEEWHNVESEMCVNSELPF